MIAWLHEHWIAITAIWGPVSLVISVVFGKEIVRYSVDE